MSSRQSETRRCTQRWLQCEGNLSRNIFEDLELYAVGGCGLQDCFNVDHLDPLKLTKQKIIQNDDLQKKVVQKNNFQLAKFAKNG